MGEISLSRTRLWVDINVLNDSILAAGLNTQEFYVSEPEYDGSKSSFTFSTITVTYFSSKKSGCFVFMTKPPACMYSWGTNALGFESTKTIEELYTEFNKWLTILVKQKRGKLNYALTEDIIYPFSVAMRYKLTHNYILKDYTVYQQLYESLLKYKFPTRLLKRLLAGFVTIDKELKEYPAHIVRAKLELLEELLISKNYTKRKTFLLFLQTNLLIA